MAILPSSQLEVGGSYVPPEQRKQKKLIILFLIALLITAGVVYYGFFYTGEVSVPDSIQQGVGDLNSQNRMNKQSEEFSFVNKVSLEDDFDLFDDPKFTGLKEFIPLLDISGQRGRVNPFARY